MLIDTETAQMLARMMAVCGFYQQRENLDVLAQALRAMSPDDENVKLAHASACISARDFVLARRILVDEVLTDNASHAVAKALLCFINTQEDKTRDNDTLIAEIRTSGDTEAIDLVDTMATTI